ncbi:MAG: hypothetical protein ACKOXG_07280, partial [Arenimonas sp.]
FHSALSRNAALLAAVISAHAALLVWLAGATAVRLAVPAFQSVTAVEFIVRRKPPMHRLPSPLPSRRLKARAR